MAGAAQALSKSGLMSKHVNKKAHRVIKAITRMGLLIQNTRPLLELASLFTNRFPYLTLYLVNKRSIVNISYGIEVGKS